MQIKPHKRKKKSNVLPLGLSKHSVSSFQSREDEMRIFARMQGQGSNREVGLSRFRNRDRVSISPSMPFLISMLEQRIQGWAMPSG